MSRIALRMAVAAISITLVSCSNTAKDAEEQYQMVEKAGGSDNEKCAAAGKVADAYLAEHNQKEYERWKLYRDTACLSAKLSPEIM